jgi:hypothetical protein
MTEIVEVRTKEVLVVHGTPMQLIAERTTHELLEKAQQGPEGIQGLKGDKGDKGDRGDQGPVGLDLNYEHVQALPSDTWVINHSLNKVPSVTVIDSSGSVVEGDVEYPTLTQVVVMFAAAFSGKAYLN